MSERGADRGADPMTSKEGGTTAWRPAAGVGIWSSSESPGSAEEARRR